MPMMTEVIGALSYEPLAQPSRDKRGFPAIWNLHPSGCKQTCGPELRFDQCPHGERAVCGLMLLQKSIGRLRRWITPTPLVHTAGPIISPSRPMRQRRGHRGIKFFCMWGYTLPNGDGKLASPLQALQQYGQVTSFGRLKFAGPTEDSATGVGGAQQVRNVCSRSRIKLR